MRRRRLGSALVVAAIVLGATVGSAQAANPEWPATALAPTSWMGDVAIDSSGSAHIAYVDGNGELRYLTNASGAWVSTPLPYTGQFTIVRIRVDSLKHVHVFVEAGTSGGIHYLTNRTGTWKDRWIGLPGTPVQGWMDAAVDAFGEVHIVAQSYTGDLMYTTNRRGYWIFQNFGPYPAFPAIALDSDRRVHIAAGSTYLSNASGTWVEESIPTSFVSESSIAVKDGVVRVMARTDGGLSYALRIGGVWTAKNLGAASGAPRFFVDVAGKSHVAVQNGNVIDYVTNAGGTWVRTAGIERGNLYGLAVSAVGRRYILFGRLLNNPEAMYLASSAPPAFTRTKVSGATFGGVPRDLQPSIAVGADGTERLAYSWPVPYGPANTNAPGLYVATRAGAAWSPVHVRAGDIRQPSIAVDASGKSHVALVEAGLSSFELWYGTDATGAWAWQLIDAGPTIDCPRIALGDTGHVFIAYGNDDGAATPRLHMATNKSGSWAVAGPLPNGINPGCAAIDIDGGDRTHLVFWASDQVNYISDTTGFFSLRTSFLGDPGPAMALDSAGKAHVLITTGGKLRYRTNATGVWVNTDLPWASPATTNLGVAIVSGAPRLSWSGGGLFFAEKSGSAWQATSLAGTSVQWASIVGTPSGGVRIGYSDALDATGSSVYVFSR